MTVATVEPEAAERHEVAALARDLSQRELAPRALQLDLREPVPLGAAWDRIAEVGFDRALLPAGEGGVGLDPGSLLPCLEEIATGDAGVALLMLLANAAVAALPAERAAQVREGERWALAPVPPRRLATPARVSMRGSAPDGPTVSGMLSPALGALGADGIVVLLDGEEPASVAMPAGARGLAVGPCSDQLGLRSAAAARLVFDDAEAEHAASGAACEETLALLRAGVAAIARGLARRAHEMALSYARERVQGGVPIVEHDAVRAMLAAMTTRMPEPPRATAAADPVAALTAKVAASEAALAITTDAVQVFGGTGYMHETGVEKLMRDAKYLQLWPEPNWLADDTIVDATLGS